MSNPFRSHIQGHADFPKKEIVYWDFTPILMHPDLRKKAIFQIQDFFKDKQFTAVACIESKGFILGSILAHEMDLPLVLIRKPGLTPGKVVSQGFTKEYGEAEYEIAEDRIIEKDRVLLVYDILAGPGASMAAIKLIEKSRAQVDGCCYAIELEYLQGRQSLEKYDPYSLIQLQEADRDAIRCH